MKKYGVDIKWLAVASFEMKFGNTTVVSDPYITDCVGTELDYTAVEKCDIITLTHSHYDHITDIPRLVEKFNPIEAIKRAAPEIEFITPRHGEWISL